MLRPLLASLLSVSAFACATAAADRVRLDDGWTFTLEGHKPRAVSVPHDWSIEIPPHADAPTKSGGGFYEAGKASYERVLTLTAEDAAAEVALEFECVYRAARVFVNGVKVGLGTFYGYTGFRIPLSGKVRAGDNALRVEVDNSAQPNCRWYSGSGILRPVWLVRGERGNTAAKALAAKPGNGLWGSDRFPKIEWSAEKGLMIGGTNVLLHGACVHHDHGPLGAAGYDGAELRKVRLLKSAGFNAVRCSHNPASDAFLSACDAEGLWVVQELCDGWAKSKNPHDYSVTFARDWERDLRWMVEKSKRHPSVIAWSIGNEIIERTSAEAAAQAAKMVKLCHELDPTRPVLEALCSWNGEPEWKAQDAMAAELDIVGYNYMEHMSEADHARCPGRVMVYTETFPRDAANTWRRIRELPYVIGEFVWTGIDYLGESSIGRTYYKGMEPEGEHFQVESVAFPWHGAYCGDIDLTGWRKPISHLRETLWNEDAPTYMAVREPDGWRGEIKTTLWGVWPMHEHWTFPGWEGKTVAVEVYSRKPRVALYLNGRMIGEKEVSEKTSWTATFDVPYEPGELKAVGVVPATKNGGAVKEEACVLRTAGEPKEVRFTTERFGELEYVTAEVVDANGVVCTDANWEVDFGEGVMATCSADLRDTVVATSRRRKAFHGRALGIRKAAK